ncbi:ferrochelatase [Leptospira broomii serovar Hurstbridge str. 5399]|uniref:Ferrochelatase n=1 Tax=Leptospira broomii serovar Hurstbridge str. 5399 TaxID=1049789 RepID=T0GI19_9LEPT|nr:ferrochelatase [Leptospira broomii]EQA46489.1 ferrochelatase [Leptospira broomii serovar Hurstbridge str. 5399]
MKNRLLLLNLGGPRSAAEIPKFLLDLFEDPFVFDLSLPEFLRKWIAKKIAVSRAKTVAETYASMGFGGGSPLVSETENQANELRKLLEESGEKWEVRIAMSCGFPDLRDLGEDWTDPRKGVIILPLYPQYSRSTVLSTAMLLKKKLGFCPSGHPGWVPPFSTRPEYLESVKNLILDYFKGNLKPETFLHLQSGGVQNWQEIDLVFSAHGIPVKLIQKGDVYVREIEQNVSDLESLLRADGFHGKIHLSFQSRVGPAKWTSPNTLDKIAELAAKNVKRIAIYPISFVSDHLETLEEIGVQIRDHALARGVMEYYRIPAPGTYPAFLEALSKFVFEAKIAVERGGQGACLCKSCGGFDPKRQATVCLAR